MESIAVAPEEREALILEMKREVKPSRRLGTHIAPPASDGLSPTEISRALFCSRATVRTVASRFLREGHPAFDDSRRSGPRPSLGDAAGGRVEKLLEEGSPTEHGWLRSRWSCKLIALRLPRGRPASAGRETVRRAPRRLEYRWRRPRPSRPGKAPGSRPGGSGRGSMTSCK